jgi:hypothetical protein
MYGTLVLLKAYAATVGATAIASAPDADNTAALARGTMFIDGSFFERFPGTPTGGLTQSEQWPRIGATDFYGDPILNTVTPQQVIDAAYEAAIIEQAAPGSLSQLININKNVKRKKTDVLETEFFAPSGDIKEALVIRVSKIEMMLKPVLMPELTGQSLVFCSV